MALLLRRIRGTERWLKALSRAGIPIAIGSGGLFWEDPRVREVVALIKAWSSPGHRLSAVTFLRAPWVGLGDEAIDALVRAGAPLLDGFLVSEHWLARRLRGLRSAAVRPGELITALLEEEAIERELGAQLLGLWHRVEEWSLRGMDFSEIALELAEAVEERRRERDVPPPQGSGQLAVLTLHGSKGLEFEHVILIDFGQKSRAQDMPLLFWDREKGAYLGTRDEEGEREKNAPSELSWRAEEARKQLAESKRLFYVALTRARERLILACPRIEVPAKKKSEDSPYAKDNWRGWVDEYGGVPARTPEGTDPSPSRPEAAAEAPEPRRLLSSLSRPQRPRHSVTEWTLLSRCARAYEWRFIRPRATAEPVVPAEGHAKAAGPDRRELGSRVHAILEAGDFGALSKLEKEVGAEHFRAEALRDWATSSDWMNPPNPARGREVWTELAFEARVGEEVLVGSIDRLVKEEGDLFRLIDFKLVGRPKNPAILLETYQTQLDLYAWAVLALEPRAKQVEAWLVAISSAGVELIRAEPRPGVASTLASQAARIVGGDEGAPSPGAVCRHCEFRAICPEARI